MDDLEKLKILVNCLRICYFHFLMNVKAVSFRRLTKGNLKLKVKCTRMYSPRTHKQDTTLVIIFQTYKRWNRQKRKKDDKRQLFQAYFGCHNLHLFAWRVAKKFIDKRWLSRANTFTIQCCSLSSATRIKIATITKNTWYTRKNLSMAAWVAKFDKNMINIKTPHTSWGETIAHTFSVEYIYKFTTRMSYNLVAFSTLTRDFYYYYELQTCSNVLLVFLIFSVSWTLWNYP